MSGMKSWRILTSKSLKTSSQTIILDGNLALSASTGNVVVGLSPNVVVTGMFEIGSGMTECVLPTQSGQPNQVISMPANCYQCGWQTVGGGSSGIEAVNGTSNHCCFKFI